MSATGLLTELLSVNIVSTKVQLSGIMGPMLQTEALHMKLPCKQSHLVIRSFKQECY